MIALLLVLAQAPSPEEIAKIQVEQSKANAEIEKKYGGKKQSELSSDERKAMMQERATAEAAILDKHGVDAKSFARASAKQSKEERAATQQAAEKLEKEKKNEKPKDTAAAPASSDEEEAKEADRQMGYGKKKR
jgi:hypothetical protein